MYIDSSNCVPCASVYKNSTRSEGVFPVPLISHSPARAFEVVQLASQVAELLAKLMLPELLLKLVCVSQSYD